MLLPRRPGTVLVTGASTGIGEATALLLRDRGHDVLAGARSPHDLERLGRAGLEPVLLDVTDPEHVARVAARTPRLHALVNNAGIAVGGPLEVLADGDWESVLRVNVLGTVAVTRAVLPALLRTRGAVVTIGSVAGRVGMPLFGPYAASKFALEAVSDVLRREVGPHGVRVVHVDPGLVATPIYDKGRASTQERVASLPPEVAARYEGQIASARRAVEQAPETGAPPSTVAQVVARALAARRPRTRYAVGRDAQLALLAARVLPDRAMDALVRRLTRG